MHFTKEEKTILITILAAAILGIAVNFFTGYGAKLRESPAAKPAALIDINAATAEEFQALPGIGKITAGRIVKYREANGNFRDIEGLKKVKGITTKKFDRLKQYVEAL
jgi:competence protein ComEA